MHTSQLPPLENDVEFEGFSCEVAKDVFSDFLAYRFGRRGQTQHGIDIRVTDHRGSYGRVVIQCHFNQNPDTKQALEGAVTKLGSDFSSALTGLTGDLAFDTFVFAGLWPTDTKLQDEALRVSTLHKKKVVVWFEETFRSYLQAHPRLKRLYAPHVQHDGVAVIDKNFAETALNTTVNPLVFYAAQGGQTQATAQQWVGVAHGLDQVRNCVSMIEARIEQLCSKLNQLNQRVSAVVYGEGGTGKSTVLRRLAMNQTQKTDWVCWWITDLDQFVEFDSTSVSEARKQRHLLFIEDWYRNVGNSSASGFFQWLKNQSHVLVIIGDREFDGRAYTNHLYGAAQAEQHEAKYSLLPDENLAALKHVERRLLALAPTNATFLEPVLNFVFEA